MKLAPTEPLRGGGETAVTLLSGATLKMEDTATPPPQELASGRVLGGRYEIRECIGSGGMGAIYAARRIHIGDTVAVKVLRPEVVQDAQSRERFQREARAAAKLHHPNAVVVHDFGQDPDGTTYIVMELLEGRSLRQVLSEDHRIAPARAVSIVRQACAAIEAAHRLGIIHRDIKPDNIFLLDSHDGVPHVKILDFGIAKLLDKTNDTGEIDPTLTQVGTVIGTPNYMSPEQCQGESLDARSDVYSLGVVMYEMLTGVQPFTAKNSTGIVIKHVTEKPRALVALRPEVPAAVERVVLKALEKKPEARQQSALDLAREFEAAVNQPIQPQSFMPVALETKYDTAVSSPKTKSSHLTLYAAAGIVILLLAGGFGWWLFSTPMLSPPAKNVSAQLPPQPAATEAVPTPTAKPLQPPEGMVLIGGAEFRLGRDDGNDLDTPSHPVTVKSFFIDTMEVTNAAYKKFLDETNYPPPPSWKDGTFAEGLDNHPVSDVTWEDARAYAKWAGKRLPTEEEWEFAARGTDGRLYPWGETYKPGAANLNNDLETTAGAAESAPTQPVGGYAEGKSPFGLYDLSGNVFEWTAS
ncbi:MAG TPA: SUMF1/EgtB/PvdO family nonheme iron enzyme, partial [Blastocatellia bacterium]|nr:SUMF1/EgtB/PvdO family nonheme iron enzyme [Blastocatellia bacterium]